MMIWVSIIAILILFFSFVGGIKEGVVKSFFNLISLIIAIPITGASYHILANLLSFLPGDDWENLVGFFITLAIVSVILHFIFLLPRKLIQKLWKKGLLYRIAGAVLNVFNASIGLTLLTLALLTYPIWGWLERAVAGSSVLIWLVGHLGFVQSLLPELFRDVAITVLNVPMLGLVG